MSASKRNSASTAGMRGSVPLLFITFILPLLFFLLTLSVDVASYYAEQEATQKVLDDAGRYASRFLPYQSNAIEAAQDYLSRFPAESEGTAVSIVADGIQFKTDRLFPFTFAKIAGVTAAGLPMSSISRTRGTPLDVAIALDASAYLAPALDAPNAWGDEQQWPAALYFEQPIFKPRNGAIDGRVLTQQCFNESFSALKLSAIEAIDYFGAFSLGAVGVGIYSGNQNVPIETIRDVRTFAQLPVQNEDLSEVRFLSSARAAVLSEDCAAVASNGGVSPSKFGVPEYSSALPSRGNFAARPLDMIIPSSRTLNPEYQPYLQAREVVWSQLVHDSEPGASAEAVTQLFAELLGAARVTERKGLTDKADKVALFFAGDVPHEEGASYPDVRVDAALRNALRTSFISYAQSVSHPAHMHLMYVLLQHEGIPDRSAEAVALQQLFDQERTSSGLSSDVFSARVLYVRNASELTATLLQSLVVLHRTSMVSL